MTKDQDAGPVAEAIERIGKAFDRRMHVRSPFHLARCGACAGPSHGQPCPHCSFYPMGEPPASRPKVEPLTRERFRQAIERSMPDGKGNLATWYFGSFRDRVAYKPHSDFARRVEAMVLEGAAMDGLPDPDAVFEAVTVRGGSPGRERLGRDENALWTALFEIKGAFDAESEAMARAERAGGAFVSVGGELRHDAGRTADLAVAAIHGDEEAWEPALDGASRAIEHLVGFGSRMGPGGRWVPTGNLASARREVEGIVERRAAVSAPTP